MGDSDREVTRSHGHPLARRVTESGAALPAFNPRPGPEENLRRSRWLTDRRRWRYSFGRGLHLPPLRELRVAMLVTHAGDAAHPVCEEHARRLDRISRDLVLWLGIGG